ncbi:hypothetical protein DSM3645_03863 [Blastopirellula marina DSM 3645]|uniref:Uncharacterized protein n=1 Tax=Blastopirellula marina DSM 3645 TaxID=314230 RepID=A3ZV73_9BACT|nr:hypothetical protein DSM3645_03863 [Blastopirellula marina DSM 3645]
MSPPANRWSAFARRVMHLDCAANSPRPGPKLGKSLTRKSGAATTATITPII